MPGILTTNDLTMSFGPTVALSSIDIDVEPGVTGLVGANGAGKSTLFKLALGLLTPTDGSITTLGLDPIAEGSALRTQVAYGPERNVLPDTMAADEFVRHLAQVRGLPRSEARSRASDMLWLVGLGEERGRTLGTMSTGQRQRVKLAQALAADPSLVLLDEPTDGLDPVQREEMLRLIRDVRDDFGIDVVVSSHVLAEVEQICDHVVAIDAGRLRVAGRLEDIATSTSGYVVDVVETPDHPRAAWTLATALLDLGFDAAVDGRQVQLTGDDHGVLADAVRDALTSTGVRLRRSGPRRVTLEDALAEPEVTT